jgi:hypothetical protein
MLEDMRWVYEKPEGKEKTAGQRVMRAFWKQSPDKFLALLIRLEAAQAKRPAAQKPVGKSEGEVGPDEATARLLEMLGEGLQERRNGRATDGW